MRRITLWLPAAVILSGSLILSACGGGQTAAPSSAPASASSAAPSSAKPSAPAASASSSPAAAASATKGSIKVGYLEPFTGPFANLAKDNRDGFTLYLDSIGNTVAGRKIEPSFADTQGQPDVGLAKAKQLVESDKVQILMGINNTPVCYAIAQYVKQAQVPLAVTGNCGAQNLTTDAKFQSPYLTRFTQTNSGPAAVAADYAYEKGYRKGVLISSDYGGGIESSDAFAATFINKGGTIVQEIHPALGTTDYGPFVAQISKDADFINDFLPGIDGLRFVQQYSNYTGTRKPIIDYGGTTQGEDLAQLKDLAVGITGVFQYSVAYDGAENKAFIKAWQEKYPSRLPSSDAVAGYTGAQALVAALKKVDGNIEQKQQFLDALYATDIQTPKGQVKLDKLHDVVQDFYVWEIVKQNGGVQQKLLKTYHGIDQFWPFNQQQSEKLQLGSHKGKWVGVTKDQLAGMMK